MAKSSNWKRQYLSIIESGVSGQGDWELARELIDEKWGRGHYQILYNTSPERVGNLVWDGPTVEGRTRADGLADEIRRSSWQHRLLTLAIHLSGWGGGLLTAYLSTLFQCPSG